MKAGILGGTFDPVHWGHLLIAEEARWQLGLDEVLFVPAGRPWFKQNQNIALAQHRLEMLRLALHSNPHFRTSTVEIDKPGASYTVDTLLVLTQELGESADLFFILGWDALSELPMWREPARIVSLCRLVAVGRPGSTQPDMVALEKAIPGISRRVIFLETLLVGISSTEIRRRAALGRSLRYLVPQAVADYIKEHGLYKGGVSEG